MDCTLINLNELCNNLDNKHGKGWSVWEAAAGGWVFQGPSGRWSVNGATMSEALIAGLNFTELPKIPPKPELFSRSEHSVVRDGAKWAIKRRGYVVCGNLKSKKYAEECIERWASKNADEREGWDTIYGPRVDGKVEGVDFVYGDDCQRDLRSIL